MTAEIQSDTLTLYLPAETLRPILKACLLFLPKDDTHPTLIDVHVVADGERVRFEATDGFRAIQRHIRCTSFPMEGYLAAKHIKSDLALMPKIGAYGLSLVYRDHKYPELTKLVPHRDLQHTLKFNPKYLADCCAATDKQGMRLEVYGEHTALVVLDEYPAHPDDVILLMPLHVPDHA